MKEYIEREKIFSIWRSMPNPASAASLSAAIHQTPAADVAPVVRCQECRYSSLPSGFTQRYGEPGTLSCHYGPCNRRNVKGDDFCSYGQRKEDGHA